MGRIAKTIIKWLFHGVCLLVVFGTIGLLIWRIFSMNVPSELKELTVNQTLADAYFENEESLTLFNQSQDRITKEDKSYGYFAVPQVVFIKEASQVQVVFRYNNSTLKHLKEDYKLSEVPPKDGEYFDLTLSVSTDLTPENEEDNDDNDPAAVNQERFYPTSSESHSTTLYNYRKFIFDGIDVKEDTIAVFVDIYYNEDIDYEKEPYGALCIFDYKTPTDYVSLSRSDIAAIEKLKK